MAQITLADLSGIRDRHKGRKIVFCSGMFDLLHPGHIVFFETCRQYGDVLVAALGADQNVKRRKNPQRPIMNSRMRMKMVDSLRVVDYCFLNTHTPVHHPQEYLDVVFKDLKPDVWVINADASDIPYRQELAEKHKIELMILERTCPPEFEGISTTSLIRRIQEMPKEQT